MNLIICDQNCRHKQDGYCALNHVSQLTDSKESKCGYFEETAVTQNRNAKRFAAAEPPVPHGGIVNHF